jgi:hypothetical protein
LARAGTQGTSRETRQGVMVRPLPAPLALLSWTLAGIFLLGGAAIGTSSLQEHQEGLRPFLAAIAGGLVLLASRLILVTRASPSWPRIEPRRSVRLVLSALASAGLLTAAYVFFAAAPGGPPFSDSWGEAAASTLGLWLGLTALAALDQRLCWRVAGAACVALLLGSVAVTIWDGE